MPYPDNYKTTDREGSVSSDGFIQHVRLDDGSNPIATDNPLPVEIPPLISTNNSTTTPLLAGATFTGTADQINGYGIIYVNTFSDQASATDGLQIQQSSDGTNWDHCDEFTIPASTGKNFSINPFAKFLRIVYINGATDQTVFRLQTILKNIGKSSSHRIQDSIIDDDDAELVKAVLTGKNPAGSFVNFQATTAGNFKISIEELESGVSVNSNSQLRVTNFDSAGNEGTKINGIEYISGNSGIDASTETLQTIPYEHHEIHSGNHYHHCSNKDQAINNVRDIQITTPNTTKWGHLVFEVDVHSETQVFLYENVTINTAGTSITPYNNNRNSVNTSDTTIAFIDNTSVANANSDTDPTGSPVLYNWVIGAGKTGGFNSRDKEIVLKQNTSYSLRFVSIAAGHVNYCLEWYEHTDKN